MSSGDSPLDVHYSDDEISTAVTEGALRRVDVMAHCHSSNGIVAALRNGVRTIEHGQSDVDPYSLALRSFIPFLGTFLNDEGIALMKKRGAFLVPTTAIDAWVNQENAKKHQLAGGTKVRGMVRSSLP